MDNIGDIISSLSESDIENLKDMAGKLFSDEESENGAGALPLNLGALGALTGSEDERCALIKSLKPMLSESRRKKADEAIKLLKLASLVPLLKESGVLKNFLEDI